jgi:hypothetical protein
MKNIFSKIGWMKSAFGRMLYHHHLLTSVCVHSVNDLMKALILLHFMMMINLFGAKTTSRISAIPVQQ